MRSLGYSTLIVIFRSSSVVILVISKRPYLEEIISNKFNAAIMLFATNTGVMGF